MAMNAKGSRREREFLEKLVKEGYVCHRVAGSGTKDSAICDIVAIKEGVPHFVEVKSRKKYFYSKDCMEQLTELIKSANACKAVPVLAVKLNNKEWKQFDLNKEIPERVPEKIV